MAKKEKIVTDPFGSYTGLVRHPEEKPVQDADDLYRSAGISASASECQKSG